MWRLTGVAVLLVFASALAASSQPPDPPSRVDRLEAWLVAIDLHEPGTADPPARMVRSWTLGQLHELDQDLALILELIGGPDFPVMWLVDPEWHGKPRRAPYELEDERRLRTLACHAAWRCRASLPRPAHLAGICAKDPAWRCLEQPALPSEVAARCVALPAEAAASCARNDIRRRGALLHTDAALRVANRAEPLRTRDAGRPDRWTIHFEDGRQGETTGAAAHTDFARGLLDDVARELSGDETVRLWHIATSAWGQLHRLYERNEKRAVELFPDDPQVLLLAGSLHETLASPEIQSMLRGARLPRDANIGVGSRSTELEEAEALLGRALDADPGLTEARVRLGRVLHLRGRSDRAAELLEQSADALRRSASAGRAADEGERLLYYAEMFLGAATEALGRHDRARDAYRRAAALYAHALSPRLALSRLALRDHDRRSAIEALGDLRPPPHDAVPPDPWLDYQVFAGRHAESWLAAFYASVAPPRP